MGVATAVRTGAFLWRRGAPLQKCPNTISIFCCSRSRTANLVSVRFSQSKIVNLKSRIDIRIVAAAIYQFFKLERQQRTR
jgi:hypothetical protein